MLCIVNFSTNDCNLSKFSNRNLFFERRSPCSRFVMLCHSTPKKSSKTLNLSTMNQYVSNLLIL